MDELELKREDYNQLTDFAMNGKEFGTKYAGMTYEDGIMAVLDVMEGNLTVEEAT